jgi:DNA-binding MarR family transcriptional regulator
MSNKSSEVRRRPRQRGAALDHGLLPGLLGYQLRLAQLAVFRDFEKHVGELGVSPGRAGVLALIESNPGVTQSELAQAVGLDRSTMVPLLDGFEERGLVERRRGTDRRTNGIWLTPAGNRLLSRLKGRITAHEARIALNLSRAERAQLVRLLKKLQPDF